MDRALVGATLVVARVGVMYGVGLAKTGDHKGRPYDQAPTRRLTVSAPSFACRKDQNPARKLMASRLTLVLMFPGRTKSFGCSRNSNSR